MLPGDDRAALDALQAQAQGLLDKINAIRALVAEAVSLCQSLKGRLPPPWQPIKATGMGWLREFAKRAREWAENQDNEEH